VLFVGFWMGRHHLRDIIVKTFTGSRDIDDSGEPMPYRLAFIGTVAGLVALVGFAACAGMKLPLAALFFGIFFVYILGITRVRAESALPLTGGPDWWSATPEQLFDRYIGSADLHPQSLAVMANMSWTVGNPKAIMPPHQIEGLKMQTESRGNPRRLMAFMIVAVLVALPVALWSTFKGYYHTGAEAVSGNRTIDFGARMIRAAALHVQREPIVDKPGIVASGVAIVFSLFLAMMRARFLWWPLHPVGFALGWSFWSNYHWFSWLLAWTVKSLTLKFGGASTYKKVMYLCMGLLVGGFANGVLWQFITLFQARSAAWSARIWGLF